MIYEICLLFKCSVTGMFWFGRTILHTDTGEKVPSSYLKYFHSTLSNFLSTHGRQYNAETSNIFKKNFL